MPVFSAKGHTDTKSGASASDSEVSPLSSMFYVPHLEIFHLNVAFEGGLGKTDTEYWHLIASLQFAYLPGYAHLLCTVTNWAFQVGSPVGGFELLKITLKVWQTSSEVSGW